MKVCISVKLNLIPHLNENSNNEFRWIYENLNK